MLLRTGMYAFALYRDVDELVISHLPEPHMQDTIHAHAV